jgi:adenine-specific DNA-methyltransferase
MNDSDSAAAGKYAGYSPEQLIAEINRLKKNKKYGLVWEHKKENVIENFETQQPYLEEVADKRIEDAPDEPTNLIIEGDNFEALSILNYTHAGKVDVIYIDPPYNTGNKDFIYNDNYVDAEDEFRHSKWLSFMEPRLKLAKKLLNDDGIICISIDENELFALKVLCDNIFDLKNYIGCAPRKSRGSATTKGNAELQTINDYLLIYAKNKETLTLQKKIVGKKSYPYSDERGDFYIVPLQDNGPHGTREARPNLWYPIYVLNNGDITYDEPMEYKEKILPKNHQNKEGRWMWSKKKFDSDKKDLYIKDGTPYIKHYFKEGEDQNKYQYEKLWLDDYQNAKGTKVLGDVLGRKGAFNNPKPVELVQYCIKLSTNKSAIILDFFAGSGTTGQAVLELNKEDGGHRQFILCTNNGDKGPDSTKIAEEITYPRIKTVITGKRQDGSKYSDGIPANLRYYKINHREKKPSIDANRQDFAPYIEDILQVKENAYKQLYVDEDFALYEAKDEYVGIIFDPFALEEIIEKIKMKNSDKRAVKMYIFSYSRDALEDEYDADFEISFAAMPEGVLRTYANIVAEIKKEDA